MTERTPRAMILAAGFGTRLGELSTMRPKPMLPVCGVPLVRWAVLWLRHHGLREFVINLHHMGDQIEHELGDGRALGVDIAYSHEEGRILGTGGGLRHARHLLDDGHDTPFVVMNAKILLDLDLPSVLEHHRRHRAEATMVLRPDPEAERWGSLRLAADHRVARLLQAVPATGDLVPVTAPLMFTGVHVVQPRLLDRIPPEGEQCVIRTAYRSLFDEGRGLVGFVSERYWWEHSTVERYLQGVFNVLEDRVPLPYAPHPVRGVDPSARIDPSATIVEPVWIGAGATIEAGATVGPLAAVGAGARVGRRVTVRRAVVWDDVVVDADATERVATG